MFVLFCIVLAFFLWLRYGNIIGLIRKATTLASHLTKQPTKQKEVSPITFYKYYATINTNDLQAIIPLTAIISRTGIKIYGVSGHKKTELFLSANVPLYCRPSDLGFDYVLYQKDGVTIRKVEKDDIVEEITREEILFD